MSIRSVTQSEVSYFHDKGWAHLPNFMEKSVAADLLKDAQSAYAEHRLAGAFSKGVDRSFTSYRPRREGAFANDVVMSPLMGRNIARLLDVPRVRLKKDLLLLKMPESTGRHISTLYHQDMPGHPFDRSHFLTLWIALHDMEPEAGTMRFYEGSHRQGMKGQVFADNVCLTQRVKSLRPEDLSPPLSLKAGDATVHHCLMIHGAPPNQSNDPRWSCAILYIDAETRFNGNNSLLPPGVHMEMYDLFDDSVFPLLPA